MLATQHTVADSWTALSPAVTELATRSPVLYSGSSWLDLEDQAHPGERFHVGIRRDAGQALASCYGFGPASNPWPAARVDLFLSQRFMSVAGPLEELLPSFLVGGRRPGHSTVLTEGGDRALLVREAVARARDEASARGAATLAALYVSDDDPALSHAFAELGAVAFDAPANHVLPLPGHSTEDWLTALGRKRRGNVLADRRKLERAGVTLHVRELHQRDIGNVVELELSNYRKYGHDYDAREAESLHTAYLQHLDRGQALLSSAIRDGDLVGFASLVRHSDSLYIRQAGFDTVSCEGLPVYMGTVFDAPVAWAYENGVRLLDLSISADKTKERKGARPQQRTAWILPLHARAQSIISELAAR